MSIPSGTTLVLWLPMWITLLLTACGGQSAPMVPPSTGLPPSPSPDLARTPGGVTETFAPPDATADTPQPETVILTPSKDNTLYENAQGYLSNGSGQHFFVGKTAAGPVRRGVIAFDIAGSLPVGSTIAEVILTLNLSRTQNEEQVLSLHRLLADWGEGESDTAGNEGSGVPASTGDATWVYRSFDREPWSQPGGDFRSTSSGNISISGPDQYSWDSTTDMVADVQMWLDRPANNFGWLLKGNEVGPRTTKRFDSREHETPENRPALIITFIPGSGP